MAQEKNNQWYLLKQSQSYNSNTVTSHSSRHTNNNIVIKVLFSAQCHSQKSTKVLKHEKKKRQKMGNKGNFLGSTTKQHEMYRLINKLVMH